MSNQPKLIVMLTHNDRTVKNAYEIFDKCKDSKATMWGFKEEGIPKDEMSKLCKYMKKCKKTAVLEVVAYEEKACVAGANLAAECGFDILMGTVYSDKVHRILNENNIKYMPFAGKLSGRPSVLSGNPEEIISEAKEIIKKGAYGIDLLGYRYTGDAVSLNESFVANINSNVCLAGSINSFKRLDEVLKASPFAFTIGGAFFEHRFGDDFRTQIDTVCDYITRISSSGIRE